MTQQNNVKRLRTAERAQANGDYGVAASLYHRVLENDPRQPMALHNLSCIYLDQTKLAEAEALLNRLFTATGFVDVKPMNTYATVLIRQRRVQEAIQVLWKAKELDPTYPQTLINLSAAYLNLEDSDSALHFAFEALKLDISNKHAFNNLGSAYGNLAMFEEAAIAFETAIDLDPNFFEAILNFGGLVARNNNHAKAIEIYETARQRMSDTLRSQEDVIRYYLAFSQLRSGMLKDAWENYEGGFHPNILKANSRAPHRKFKVPKWNGESLEHKKLLIWREQGLSDEILFMSCLPDLTPHLGNVIVECDKRMVSIFARSFPDITCREQNADLELNAVYDDFDYHLPMGSLMRFTRPSLESFENSKPYIVVDESRLADFRSRLESVSAGRKTIGIAWRSGISNALRALEATTLQDWAPILENRNACFINLQYGDCDAEIKAVEEKLGIKIVGWDDLDLKNDLESIFALMKNLDYIVSTGTAVYSMAGAVGANGYIIKTTQSWQEFDLKYNPWYKNLKIYKNIDNNIDVLLTEIGKDISKDMI